MMMSEISRHLRTENHVPPMRLTEMRHPVLAVDMIDLTDSSRWHDSLSRKGGMYAGRDKAREGKKENHTTCVAYAGRPL